MCCVVMYVSVGCTSVLLCLQEMEVIQTATSGGGGGTHWHLYTEAPRRRRPSPLREPRDLFQFGLSIGKYTVPTHHTGSSK